MIDIKLIRESPEIVRANLQKRSEPEMLKLLDKLIAADKTERELTMAVNRLRHRRNELSLEIAKLKRQGKDVSELLREAAKIPAELKGLESKLAAVKEQVHMALMRLPNILHESVPFGKDETENVEIRRWHRPPVFKFEPLGHVEILKKLGLADFERAHKVAGHGFFYLKGPLVLLDLAIQRYAIDLLLKRGYALIEPPLMLRRRPYEGVTDLADFEHVMYKVQDLDLYPIATSEHAMAAMFMDEVLDRASLPIKLVGVSPCFRREVGAHGKYTKGLFRVHQFNKVEQFIFCLPEQSWKLHEELQKNAEDLYKGLGLHFRVVNVCTGDIGIVAAKKYDIEIWMADGKYREVGSNSNCTDYQARRLNIRWREGPGKPPAGFVHTLNNTALATSRTMIAILEQYQQADGSVEIPRALWPYMAGIKKLQP
jgi:seryl-tRNA synthetase